VNDREGQPAQIPVFQKFGENSNRWKFARIPRPTKRTIRKAVRIIESQNKKQKLRRHKNFFQIIFNILSEIDKK
jgi:hypothetical protein